MGHLMVMLTTEEGKLVAAHLLPPPLLLDRERRMRDARMRDEAKKRESEVAAG